MLFAAKVPAIHIQVCSSAPKWSVDRLSSDAELIHKAARLLRPTVLQDSLLMREQAHWGCLCLTVTHMKFGIPQTVGELSLYPIEQLHPRVIRWLEGAFR